MKKNHRKEYFKGKSVSGFDKNQIFNVKKIIFCFFVLCCVFNSYTQFEEGQIIYGQKFVDGVASKPTDEGIESELKSIYENLQHTSRSITYLLRFNQKFAEYKAQEILDNEINGFQNEDLAILAAEGEGSRFFDRVKQVAFWKTHSFGEDVIVVDTLKYSDWNLGSETKKIGDYLTYKATLNRVLDNGEMTQVVAWYAPDIPVNCGPKNFHGLPGLILELQDHKFIFYAKEIVFKKNRNAIKKPEKGVIMSLNEYRSFVLKAEKNLPWVEKKTSGY